MIGDPIPDRHELARVELADQVAQFLAAGGKVEVCKPAGNEPRPPHFGAVPPPRVADPQHKAERDLLQQARQAAKTMTLNEAYQKLGVSRTTLHRLAKEGGFFFPRHDKERVRREVVRQEKAKTRAALIEKVRAHSRTGLARSAVATQLGISNHLLIRLIQEGGIDFPRWHEKP